jgi:hypothetical protein
MPLRLFPLELVVMTFANRNARLNDGSLLKREEPVF